MSIFHKNRILKGNVSIMIILILLACSLMGILTVVFLKSLITYTDDTYSYHKSYYIAKAGLELALTEIDNSSMGFSHDINSGDFINENNFGCVGCYFISHIQGRSSIISNSFWQNGGCTESGALVLQQGQSMVVPMFFDNASGFSQIFSEDDIIEQLGGSRNNLSLSGYNGDAILNIGVVFQSGSLTGDISWEYLYMTGMAINDLLFHYYFDAFDAVDATTYGTVWYNLPSLNLFPYMIISNPGEDTISFCITDDSNTAWPTTKYFISSLGEYMGKTVGLQAIYAQPTPSFFIDSYSSSDGSVVAQGQVSL